MEIPRQKPVQCLCVVAACVGRRQPYPQKVFKEVVDPWISGCLAGSARVHTPFILIFGCLGCLGKVVSWSELKPNLAFFIQDKGGLERKPPFGDETIQKIRTSFIQQFP
jgi:hypothetical protein